MQQRRQVETEKAARASPRYIGGKSAVVGILIASSTYMDPRLQSFF
jgi:hypothetical protein